MTQESLEFKLGLEMQLVIALFSLLPEGSGSVPSIVDHALCRKKNGTGKINGFKTGIVDAQKVFLLLFAKRFAKLPF